MITQHFITELLHNDREDAVVAIGELLRRHNIHIYEKVIPGEVGLYQEQTWITPGLKVREQEPYP
ncbi:MAG: hypothetical protein AAF702_01560 [Chloroflexota bacterium]